MAGLTQELARFVADQNFVPPAEAIEIAKSGFVDVFGVMVSGRSAPVVGVARDYLEKRAQFSLPESSVLLNGGRASAEAAALINGVAGHVLDYDDVGLRAHPSVTLVPAIVAEAERRKLSGRDALNAYVVGYEVWAELNAREPGPLHAKGWHPTTVIGVVAVAAAIAHLARLDVTQTRNALAIAASMAAGLTGNFGSMTKSFQVGRAGASGIEAVRLAEGGMTGQPDVIEHQSGLLSALSPDREADLSDPATPLGTKLRLLESGLSFKKYPMCYCTHRVIDGAIDIANAADLKPSQVESIDVRIGTTQHAILRNDRPLNALEGKFSIQFAIAAALTSRACGMAEVEDNYVKRPDIQNLIGKVTVEEDASVCPVEPAFCLNDRLKVTLKDGSVLDSGDLRFARGHALMPLKPGELKTKFMDCCRGANDIDAEALFDKLSALERLPDMAMLAQG